MKVLEGRDNPCYDKKTNTHCQKRCAGCGTTCKAWKEYEQERNKDYNTHTKQKSAFQTSMNLNDQRKLENL